MSKIDLYGQMEQAYFAGDSVKGVHFLSSFLEKQVRLAVCLHLPQIDLQTSLLRIPRSAGLGEYLKTTLKIAEYCDAEGAHRHISKVCHTIVAPFLNKTGDRTIKEYRDFLSHGGIEPSGDDLHRSLIEAKNENAKAIRAYINECGGVSHIDGAFQLGNGSTLYPLIIGDPSCVALFQDATGDDFTFYTFDANNPSLNVGLSDTQLIHDLSRYLVAPGHAEDRRRIGLYKDGIQKDLKGFHERQQAFIFRGSYSPFELEWARRTSEGHEFRSDHFRVNTNNAHEWKSPEGWADYASFLKIIANWGAVVQRSLERLDRIDAELRQVEAEQFSSLSTMKIPESVTTKFTVQDFIGSSFPPEDSEKPSSLNDIIDESATNATGVPQIFFLRGEAGIGKTYSLLKSSRERAYSLREAMPHKPLYLYISCSGVGLKKVEDIINAAVVETRNLDFATVMALSRNGLLVLVIDGFDELVGGTGYDNAFQLLRPVLNQLGGSGTLVLSARSSYFANQYQTNLQTAKQLGGLPAHHLILELQRWTRHDVDQLFSANSHWSSYRSSISSSDFSLLGVPFFAQAFNDATLSSSEFGNFQGLRSTLIDSFLVREKRKLEGRSGQSPVSVPQLRAIFQEVSGLLFESGESSLDLDDFRLACETALQIDGFHGPNQALGDRLTVLCGVSASADSQGSPLFSFQHDIFFEVILADYLIQQYLTGPHGHKSMLLALERAPLGDATIASIVERAPNDLSSFLAEPSVSKKDSESVGSLNLAALVSHLISTGGCAPSSWYQDMHFISLDLTPLEELGLQFTGCRIDRLTFSTASTGTITFTDCRINYLEVLSDETEPLRKLTFLGHLNVQELTILRTTGSHSIFESGSARVLESLDTFGAKGVERQLQEVRDARPSELELFAGDVLAGMSARAENAYIVMAKSRIPGDSAGRGMYRPHNPLWADLTDILVESDVASLKQITASGAQKCVVTFRFSSSALCQRDSTEPKIQAMWRSMR